MEDISSLRGRIIKIHSDSQAAIKALNSNRVVSTLVSECIDNLDKLAENNQVILIWIPGHSGHEGNEKADLLARTGSSKQFYGPEPAIGISYRWFKTAIKDWMYSVLTKSWLDSPTCRQAKMMIDELSSLRSHRLLHMPRHDLRLVVGVMIGHIALNRHLHLMGLVDSPLCERCNQEEETTYHFVGRCPSYGPVRQRCLGAFIIDSLDLKLIDPSHLLAFIKATRRFEVCDD